MSRTIKEGDLIWCLNWFKDFRACVIRDRIDPFAARQGLLVMLEMDTDAALAKGINPEKLKAFDEDVRKDVREWIRQRRAMRPGREVKE